MNIKVLFFGRLAEYTSTGTVTIPQVKDTNDLVQQLQQQYPSLINASYSIAVNKLITCENTLLSAGATVALLPPFSGG